jgi:hypothetical protein
VMCSSCSLRAVSSASAAHKWLCCAHARCLYRVDCCSMMLSCCRCCWLTAIAAATWRQWLAGTASPSCSPVARLMKLAARYAAPRVLLMLSSTVVTKLSMTEFSCCSASLAAAAPAGVRLLGWPAASGASVGELSVQLTRASCPASTPCCCACVHTLPLLAPAGSAAAGSAAAAAAALSSRLMSSMSRLSLAAVAAPKQHQSCKQGSGSGSSGSRYMLSLE